MRTMKDACGLEVRPAHVEGHDTYDGLIIQCRPHLVFKLHQLQAREWMQKARGRHADGLDELTRLSQPPSDPDDDVWPARERWSGKVVLPPQWPTPLRHYLWIRWFQETGDPMQRLAEILAGLDFMALSAVEEHIYDD